MSLCVYLYVYILYVCTLQACAIFQSVNDDSYLWLILFINSNFIPKPIIIGNTVINIEDFIWAQQFRFFAIPMFSPH